MKNAWRALFAALIVLAGVLLIRHYQHRLANRPVLAFEGLSVDSVSQLSVEFMGQNVTLKKRGVGWVTAGDGFPADTARLRRVLGHLVALQKRETVAHDASGNASHLNLYEYGLDSASARFVVFRLFDGRTFRVALGKVSGIDFGSSFWKPQDQAVVYRTPGKFVFEVSSRAQDWKDTNLYAPVLPDEIRSVAVQWRESKDLVHGYTLERELDTSAAASPSDPTAQKGFKRFVVYTPESGPRAAHTERAEKLFTYATQFKIDGFAPGVDRSAMYSGLDQPLMTIRITLKNGTVRLIEAGSAVDGLYRHIRHPTHKDPVRVFGWRFEYFRKRGEELVRP